MMPRFVALILFGVTAGPSGFGTDYTARVIGISDGDTLTVLRSDRS